MKKYKERKDVTVEGNKALIRISKSSFLRWLFTEAYNLEREREKKKNNIRSIKIGYSDLFD